MRYISIIFGMLKMCVVSLFSFGGISFSFPVRVDANVSLSVRKSGIIRLGRCVSLNRHARISATEKALIEVGNDSLIGYNNVIISRERISIGDNVMLGANVCIYDHDHVYSKLGIMREQGYTTAPVTIEDNVWIGAGVIVLKGVTIGSGSVIAAGTVVKRDIPENSLVYNQRELVIRPRIPEEQSDGLPD